jgi:flagellar export protein FliJ
MTPKTLKRTLSIKERIRQWRRAELHEAQTRVDQAESSLQLEAARHTSTAALLTRAGEFSANDLALAAEQVQATQRALREAAAELQARQQEHEERQTVMGEATREVRAIEALHTRMLAEQKREADRREQRDLDEASARKGKPA